MRIQRLGEKALILRDLPCEAFKLARTLNSSPSKPDVVLEAVASYETVGIYCSEPRFELSTLEQWIERHFEACNGQDMNVQEHVLPVCYELGKDLSTSAHQLGISVEQLIACHSSRLYRCYAVGFSPGFAYLGYLPDEISGLPRLPDPRKRVEPGSVGITGRQTAVYPSATPGGWNLIGKCPLTLVDEQDDYFPIEAGDLVRFTRIAVDEFHRLEGSRL
jgi:inhibitor of KinA